MYGIFLFICNHISVLFNIVISTIYDSEEGQIAKQSIELGFILKQL